MGILDRARSLVLSPADRRLQAAAREAFESAPTPSAALAVRAAGEPPQGSPNTPAIGWTRDQPPAPPSRHAFRPGYSDHTYQQYSAPLAFEGFDLEGVRAAVARHRLGYFWETSALMVTILGFAPVLAALQQAIAPILALPRRVHGGDKGLARLVALEVEDALCPRGGLLPSPYLLPTLWGTTAINLRMMGFAVLQHVDGDPDPDTGVRPRFTRTWPAWAVNIYRAPRKVIALTSEGPVEVCNDGKFTLVADEEEGYLSAAILALGEETLLGKITQQSRASFLNFFGEPKLWATPPEHVATGIDDADGTGGAFWSCIQTIRGPGGFGVLPHGSNLQAVGISGEGSNAFSSALVDALIHIFMVLTGSAGTIGAGGATGAGPYQPQKGGAWNVRHDLIARPVAAMIRGINQGHVAPYIDQNYGDEVARARRAGVWIDPVLDIPIPAPDRDERTAADAGRQKLLVDLIVAERAAGAVVTQDRVNKLASILEAQPFTLVDGGAPIPIEAVEKKLAAPDEWRAQQGLAPLADGAGSAERLAEERLKGGDEAGAVAKVEAAEVKNDEAPTTQRAPGVAPESTGGAAFVAAAADYIRARVAAGATRADVRREVAALQALAKEGAR